MSSDIVPDAWAALTRVTPARIALGRAGASLPTTEVLRFALAHARARDAVHAAFDADTLVREVEELGFEALAVSSAAPSRATYVRRPDLGRSLASDSRRMLAARVAAPADLAVVIADGLSATATHIQAVPLLRAFMPFVAAEGWRLAPIVIAREARVALGDEIGALLKARIVAVFIGERPGLSSPDSLGVYLTYAPRPGRTDAERNCLSNIRAEGLAHDLAAKKLAWLVGEASRRQLSGVALKDESDLLDSAPAARLPPS